MNAPAIASGSGVRKWWALGGVMLAVLAVGLDATVLSVALPTLAVKLHASKSDLQWFSSGYLLVLAALMLPAGLLGDRFGRKRVMLGALLLFGLASAGCAISQTSGEFLAARVLLGFAGAPLIVMAMSALAVLFTPEERPKAVGIWAAVNFVSLPDRAHPGRLHPQPRLVGLGVPDERPGRPAGPGRRAGPGPGDQVRREAGARPGRRGALDRRAGGPHLRPDPGRSGRLGQPERRPAHGHRCRPARRVPALGGPASPAAPAASRSSTSRSSARAASPGACCSWPSAAW